MPISRTTLFAMLVLCWVLVLVWLQAGFLAALALAAFTDLAITLAAGFRSRRRSAGLKRRDGS